MTKFIKKSEINSDWIEIDATNAVVGRLATIITKILRGKNKNSYSPHVDHGDFVIVKIVENHYFWDLRGLNFILIDPDRNTHEIVKIHGWLKKEERKKKKQKERKKKEISING